MNREAWLAALVDRLRPMFLTLQSPVPQQVGVSVGFPSTRALPGKSQRIGECWHAEASADGVHQVFISPLISDPLRVADILVHELVHAALPSGTGHKKPFASLATKLGLEGKPTATSAGPELTTTLRNLLLDLGDYPHAGLSAVASARKKQTTRLLKAECPTCGYTVRVTQTWLDVGAPLCPTDHIAMTTDLDKEEAA